MFDFQKLEIYHKAKHFAKGIREFTQEKRLDYNTSDQLKRASFSIMLNIAEGSSRFSNRDRKNFMVISRGSVFECVAILEFLFETGELEKKEYNEYSRELEELSKMLYALIRKFDS